MTTTEDIAVLQRLAASLSADLLDGGVTAAAFEAEAVSPERARSLVQERDEALTYAAETIATAQAETTAAVTRAEKAEQELEQSRRGYGALMDKLATTARQRDEADKRASSASPRPLTADDYERGVPVLRDACPEGFKLSIPAHEAVRAIVDAALTPPPSRPEGAEDLKHPVVVALAGMDSTRVHGLTQEDIEGLCDRLAERGVRVTEEQS